MLRLYGKATGKQRPLSLRPGGRGLMAGMEAVLGCLLNLFFAFSSLLSPTGILSLSIRYNDIFAGKTNTLFSFLEGTNGE